MRLADSPILRPQGIAGDVVVGENTCTATEPIIVGSVALLAHTSYS